MKVRLNMTKLKCNYKGTQAENRCSACNIAEETTEHVMKCKVYKKLVMTDIENII